MNDRGKADTPRDRVRDDPRVEPLARKLYNKIVREEREKTDDTWETLGPTFRNSWRSEAEDWLMEIDKEAGEHEN